MDIKLKIIRNGQEMEVPFSEIKKGDKVPTGNPDHPIIVGSDAHESGDAYDGWLFYDTNGNSYFPEDFVKEPGLNVAIGGKEIFVILNGCIVTGVVAPPELKGYTVTVLDDTVDDEEEADRIYNTTAACEKAVKDGKMIYIY